MRLYVVPGAVHPKPAGLLQTLNGIDWYRVPGGVVFFEGRERRCVAGGVFVKRDAPVRSEHVAREGFSALSFATLLLVWY